jgi:hypothetical protein
MEQTSHFNDFLKDVVNLPQSKLDHLDERVERIFAALKAADLGTRVLGMKKQGSWAQRTIINPAEHAEFDADFMLELEEHDGWSPADYQAPVLAALEAYVEAQSIKTPAEAKNRCVRVTYANDMHVDVVPYVNRDPEGQCILNTDTNDWEETDPDGFTQWVKDKNAIAKGNLKLVLRLLKYVRDHRGYYSDTKSVILTTIVGNLITDETARSHPGCYDNVSRALRRITADLADWVRYQSIRPEVDDPSPNSSTSFTRRWLQAEYDDFRRDIQTVADLVDAAINTNTSWSDSTEKWRELFGESFGPSDTGSSSSKFPATGAGAGAAGTELTSTRSGRAG